MAAETSAFCASLHRTLKRVRWGAGSTTAVQASRYSSALSTPQKRANLTQLLPGRGNEVFVEHRQYVLLAEHGQHLDQLVGYLLQELRNDALPELGALGVRGTVLPQCRDGGAMPVPKPVQVLRRDHVVWIAAHEQHPQRDPNPPPQGIEQSGLPVEGSHGVVGGLVADDPEPRAGALPLTLHGIRIALSATRTAFAGTTGLHRGSCG